MNLLNFMNFLRFVSFLYQLSLRSILHFLFLTLDLTLHLGCVWVPSVVPTVSLPDQLCEVVFFILQCFRTLCELLNPIQKVLIFVCFLLFVIKNSDTDKWYPRKRTIRRDRVISTKDAHSPEVSRLTQEWASLSHSFMEQRILPLSPQGAL